MRIQPAISFSSNPYRENPDLRAMSDEEIGREILILAKEGCTERAETARKNGALDSQRLYQKRETLLKSLQSDHSRDIREFKGIIGKKIRAYA